MREIIDFSSLVLWRGEELDSSREVWSPCPNFESEYLISSFGRIVRISGGAGTRPGVVRKYGCNTKGYATVVLYDGGRVRTRVGQKVHRLVARAFLKNTFGVLAEVHHKDGERMNNQANNLEWRDPKEHHEQQYQRYLRGLSVY